jgi:hypothetical protein
MGRGDEFGRSGTPVKLEFEEEDREEGDETREVDRRFSKGQLLASRVLLPLRPLASNSTGAPPRCYEFYLHLSSSCPFDLCSCFRSVEGEEDLCLVNRSKWLLIIKLIFLFMSSNCLN